MAYFVFTASFVRITLIIIENQPTVVSITEYRCVCRTRACSLNKNISPSLQVWMHENKIYNDVLIFAPAGRLLKRMTEEDVLYIWIEKDNTKEQCNFCGDPSTRLSHLWAHFAFSPHQTVARSTNPPRMFSVSQASTQFAKNLLKSILLLRWWTQRSRWRSSGHHRCSVTSAAKTAWGGRSWQTGQRGYRHLWFSFLFIWCMCMNWIHQSAA